MKIINIKNKLLQLDYGLLLFLGFALISATYILFNLHIGRIGNLGNYKIFVNSFGHLINHKNLYISFNDGLDLYKYSPTFALFMGLFFWAPDYIGIICWHIFNLLILYIAVKDLEDVNNKLFLYCFILITSWGSFQVSQVNAMMGGLTYLFSMCLYKRKLNQAAILLAASTFIKIYSGFAIILLILFKEGRSRFLLYYLSYCILLFLLPLIVMNFHQLLQLYFYWGNLLYNDSHSYGLSIIGAYAQLLPMGHYTVIIINLLGLIYMLIIFMIIIKSRVALSKKIIYNIISLLMLWMVIFNHKAESQTYILAYIGIAIWFFTNTKNSVFNYTLVLIVFVINLLSDTRIGSHNVKIYLLSHCIEAIACFPVWLKISSDILKYICGNNLKSVQLKPLFKFLNN